MVKGLPEIWKTWVQSLVGDLKSHMPWGQKKKKIETTKALKMVHIKKKKILEKTVKLQNFIGFLLCA